MVSIIFRTVIIYIILLVTMRLMGKRQLGELEMSEFVITILLSEIASLPITNTDMPILFAIVPIAVLVSFEIIVSFLIIKCPKFKKIFTTRPSVIISRGKINKKEMLNVRISIEELISQVRQNGIYDLEEVDYAILEENGKMSIIPKSKYRQPDILDMHLPDSDSGVMHIIISDGIINDYNIRLLHKDTKWVSDTLAQLNIKQKEVLCMTLNDSGSIFVIKNNGNTLSHKERL